MPHLDLLALLIRVPPLLFALTIHEFAHGWAALKCGDPTARDMGRLTLNPLVHLDPLGTLCLLFAPFGWAKPVPVDPRNFRHPRRDDILVSLAGVGANFVTACLVALVMRGALAAGFHPMAIGTSTATRTLWLMGELVCLISIGLMLFNLLPIPPLDGSHVLANLLPPRQALTYRRVAPFGGMVLLLLVLSGAFGVIFWPPLRAIVGALLGQAWILTS